MLRFHDQLQRLRNCIGIDNCGKGKDVSQSTQMGHESITEERGVDGTLLAGGGLR
ncbi:hypothetical protein Alches_12540 [Alicyclobacillus hesperidum subsp. aegles]|nr:hypothetical protein Alches_12540 [Alicyclobacillus hesperidum subsp. aegles]